MYISVVPIEGIGIECCIAAAYYHKCRARAYGSCIPALYLALGTAAGSNRSSSVPPAAIYSVAVHKTNFRYELLLQQQLLLVV